LGRQPLCRHHAQLKIDHFAMGMPIANLQANYPDKIAHKVVTEF